MRWVILPQDSDWWEASRHLREVAAMVGPYLPAGADLLSVAKGLEPDSLLRENLLEILSRHVATRSGDDPTRWLFEGENGNPPHQNTVTYYWSKAKAAALGHANPATTLRIYAHLWPTAEDRTRAASGRLLMAALGQAADSPRTSEGREVR